MATTNPDEVFRFISLRQPTLIRDAEKPDNHARYVADDGASNLYNSLIALKGSKDARSQMLAAAMQHQHLEASELDRTTKSLYARFKGFEVLGCWLADSDATTTWESFQSEAERLLGASLASYVSDKSYASNKDLVWQQYFALMVTGADSAAMEATSSVLRLLRLIEQQADKPGNGSDGFAEARGGGGAL